MILILFIQHQQILYSALCNPVWEVMKSTSVYKMIVFHLSDLISFLCSAVKKYLPPTSFLCCLSSCFTLSKYKIQFFFDD